MTSKHFRNTHRVCPFSRKHLYHYGFLTYAACALFFLLLFFFVFLKRWNLVLYDIFTASVPYVYKNSDILGSRKSAVYENYTARYVCLFLWFRERNIGVSKKSLSNWISTSFSSSTSTSSSSSSSYGFSALVRHMASSIIAFHSSLCLAIVLQFLASNRSSILLNIMFNAPMVIFQLELNWNYLFHRRSIWYLCSFL